MEGTVRELPDSFATHEPAMAVSEETASINGCQLHYQTLGQAHLAGWSHPAVLAMVGHSGTLNWWGDLVPAALAARGFFVILFDHRGTGRSTPMTCPAAQSLTENSAVRTPC